ncbi:hypothetical protein [Argonema antarcticum]|uniref:hypothetical protein n=1 Tax=Argonema antarcticum TaxID=2942763 RepID=UPI0020112F02|nr:hypothetical protein [Argonema antarcticum]MCL1470573.1 hypothetical protein [Argonema antarcticum A004/B2]
MVNIGYRAARMQGHLFRSLYTSFLPWIVKLPIPQTYKVQITVYSFSCDRDLPEQVASIRSFIRYVGIPDEFIVISDGTYSPASCQLLRQISPCVDVVDMESILKKDLPQCVYAYADSHPLGKKLAVLMSIPINQATIYADSDILFFPGAKGLITLTQSVERQPRCLLDCALALDRRFIHNEFEKISPVNSGFMLLQEPLNWEIPIKRFVESKDVPNYFTEQTMIHLTMHYNQAKPLCARQFLVQLDDQFIYSDKYAGNKIALRHYVSPVRHKFWLAGVI